MKTITIKAIVTNDGTGYYAYCPSIKGLHVWGETLEEVDKNVKDAIVCHLKMIIAHGEHVPNDEKFNNPVQKSIVACYNIKQYNDMVYA